MNEQKRTLWNVKNERVAAISTSGAFVGAAILGLVIVLKQFWLPEAERLALIPITELVGGLVIFLSAFCALIALARSSLAEQDLQDELRQEVNAIKEDAARQRKKVKRRIAALHEARDKADRAELERRIARLEILLSKNKRR